jgi:hypothetical protein
MKLILGISFFCQHNSTGGGFLILKQIIHAIGQLKTYYSQKMMISSYYFGPPVLIDPVFQILRVLGRYYCGQKISSTHFLSFHKKLGVFIVIND